MTAGLVLGGIGIAVSSGVMAARAAERGDTLGAAFGGLGVIGGRWMAAGAIGVALGVAGAPVLLAAGVVLALAVGVFSVGRHFGFW